MGYSKVDGRVVAELKNIVGAQYVWTDNEKMEPYSHDAVTGDQGYPAPHPQAGKVMDLLAVFPSAAAIAIVPNSQDNAGRYFADVRGVHGQQRGIRCDGKKKNHGLLQSVVLCRRTADSDVHHARASMPCSASLAFMALKVVRLGS